jgi:hypothetical protein
VKPSRWWILAAVGALVLWAGFDLYGPRRVDIREFDPMDVARLDTAMWRSYYDRKPLVLFLQLADLMRRQFHFPFLRSYAVAASAARAAFVFKDGHRRADYERALPDLIRYYRAIRAISTTSFDVPRTARLELEWWIVHRERLRHGAGDLDRALADAAAALYRVPAAGLAVYGRERTAAMDIRDREADSGGVRESDWQAIERHLQASWRSLHDFIQPVLADRPRPAGGTGLGRREASAGR